LPLLMWGLFYCSSILYDITIQVKLFVTLYRYNVTPSYPSKVETVYQHHGLINTVFQLID
jgi:hypothetical protein